MHERSLVSIKVEPRSTSRLISTIIFRLYFIYVIKMNVRCQKRVSGNQPYRRTT